MKLSKSCRVATCGAFAAGKDADGLVTVHRTVTADNGPVAAFGNLARCGSAHLCPWCAAKVRAERSRLLDDHISPFLAAGGRATYAVFTIANERFETIEETTAAVDRVWARFTRWVRDQGLRQSYGIVGDVTGYEFTVRLDGSGHPHINVIYLQHGTEGEYRQWQAQVLAGWHFAAKFCGRRTHIDHGVRVLDVGLDASGRIRELADYVAKGGESSTRWGLTDELTRQDAKQARSDETFAPFDLLRHFATTGDTAARGAWQAYERASKGKAVAKMSRGLLGYLATVKTSGNLYGTVPAEVEPVETVDQDDDLTVEESYVDEAPEHSPAVATFDHHAWRWIRHHGYEAVVLRIVEACDDPTEIVPTLRALARRQRLRVQQWPESEFRWLLPQPIHEADEHSGEPDDSRSRNLPISEATNSDVDKQLCKSGDRWPVVPVVGRVVGVSRYTHC